jgi:dihydroflavonol-4-reductase
LKILLTGSTGLLGSHLLEQGLEKGYHFKLPTRKISPRSYLNSVVENPLITHYDVSDSWDDAIFKDVDFIIHCAGLASPFEKDFEEMDKVNIELTKYLYERKGKAKFVHISSIATLSSGSEDYTISEDNPGRVRDTYYAQTKKKSETWLEEQNDSELLIIHPCYMLGKYDSRPSSGSIFFTLKMGKVSEYINNVKNFVAASDVASGIYQALEKGNISGHYILGGENIELKYFFKQALVELQLEKELTQVTHPDHGQVREFCTSNAISFDKAMNDFAYNPIVNLREMVRESIRYFADKKMLRVKPRRPKIGE